MLLLAACAVTPPAPQWEPYRDITIRFDARSACPGQSVTRPVWACHRNGVISLPGRFGKGVWKARIDPVIGPTPCGKAACVEDGTLYVEPLAGWGDCAWMEHVGRAVASLVPGLGRPGRDPAKILGHEYAHALGYTHGPGVRVC